MILAVKIWCCRAAFWPLAITAMLCPVPWPALERAGERLLLRTIDLENQYAARKHLSRLPPVTCRFYR